MEKNIKKKCIYVYNWITFLYCGDWHNTVHQPYFNRKKNWRKNIQVKKSIIESNSNDASPSQQQGIGLADAFLICIIALSKSDRKLISKMGNYPKDYLKYRLISSTTSLHFFKHLTWYILFFLDMRLRL